MMSTNLSQLDSHLKIAIVHDWLVSYRGGEKVLESLGKIFPKAPIYTLFYSPEKLPPFFREKKIIYPKKLNYLRKIRKFLLPALPRCIENLTLDQYDLIISTSSCVAKGAICGPKSKHLCYIHSPMRYIWDLQDQYFEHIPFGPSLQKCLWPLTKNLRKWDVESSKRVHQFVANSSFIAGRVARYYQRESLIVHPPVKTFFFNPREKTKKEDYFIIAGSFVPYKKFDLAIKACNKLKIPLIVAGSGQQEKYLRSLAGRTIKFEISPSDERMRELLQKARAFIFPGIEDFGIIAIEALASGTAVLAYKGGGACDFISSGTTGSFFKEQNLESLVDCLQNFKDSDFNQEFLIDESTKYSEENFECKIKDIILKMF